MTRNRVLIAAAAVLVIGGGLFAARTVFLGDAPEEVSLSNATEQPSTQNGASFDGTWTVDTESGTFDYDAEEFTSTYAGYRVNEELVSIGANTAVGRTRDVEGTLTIAGNRITEVSITVDMTTLQSDSAMRDNAIRTRGLETGRFPTATFELTEPITIGSEPAQGEEIEAQATGNVTLHGVTKQVTIPITARRSGERITVVSSFDVALADYEMERPTTARVLSVNDEGTIELQLHFVKS